MRATPETAVGKAKGKSTAAATAEPRPPSPPKPLAITPNVGTPEWDQEQAENERMERRVKEIMHPTAGLLRLDFTYLWLGRRLGTRIVTYTPADDQTDRRLESLHRSLQATADADAA